MTTLLNSFNMESRSHNEYSTSTRAQKDENDLFSAIGKQVLGMKLDDEGPAEDERVKVVEEIESLCMSCEENVSCSARSENFID